jgi:peroxiredoxin Q/BCP
MVKEGEKAPGFHVMSDSGEKLSLSDYHGKNVILFFFPKADTPG